MSAEGTTVPNYVSLKVCDEMYTLIAREADKRGVPMIEVVVSVLANHFKRPDLNFVPRQRMGRPRKQRAVTA